MTPAQELKKQNREQARVEKDRAWVNQRPEQERHLIREFGIALFSTADRMVAEKATAEGIGAFLSEYVYGRGHRSEKGRKKNARQKSNRA